MRWIIAVAIVVMLFVSWSVVDAEPTAAECCIEQSIRETCVKHLYRAVDGELKPDVSCERYRK
jgi:hypothetical protein